VCPALDDHKSCFASPLPWCTPTNQGSPLVDYKPQKDVERSYLLDGHGRGGLATEQLTIGELYGYDTFFRQVNS